MEGIGVKQWMHHMAMRWRMLKVPTSTGNAALAGAKKKPSLCNSLMPSSAEQIKLSKATTQPPLALTTGHLTCWRKWTLHCTVSNYSKELSGSSMGSLRALLQHKRLRECFSQLQIFQCSICKMIRMMHVANPQMSWWWEGWWWWRRH